MIEANVKINFDPKGVQNRIASQTHRNQFLLDQQVAKDSNYYCPRAGGDLQGSVLPSAAEGKGLLVWNEKYAARQYYDLPNKNTKEDGNPNARMKWFEVAKRACRKKWEKVANIGFN